MEIKKYEEERVTVRMEIWEVLEIYLAMSCGERMYRWERVSIANEMEGIIGNMEWVEGKKKEKREDRMKRIMREKRLRQRELGEILGKSYSYVNTRIRGGGFKEEEIEKVEEEMEKRERKRKKEKI